jgi:hypothetical protein
MVLSLPLGHLCRLQAREDPDILDTCKEVMSDFMHELDMEEYMC